MPHANRPLLIGLTGGIASGKSTAAKMLQERGYTVISSDHVAHEALQEQGTIAKLVKRFGEHILENGVVNRRKLGEIIFNDATARADLNAIVHPRVRARLDGIVTASSESVLFIEIPLLFDSGLGDRFDAVVTIEADIEQRTDALMRRDDLQRQQALTRIHSQLTSPERQRLADRVVVNPMTIEKLAVEIDSVVDWLPTVKKRRVKTFTG